MAKHRFVLAPYMRKVLFRLITQMLLSYLPPIFMTMAVHPPNHRSVNIHHFHTPDPNLPKLTASMPCFVSKSFVLLRVHSICCDSMDWAVTNSSPCPMLPATSDLALDGENGARHTKFIGPSRRRSGYDVS